MIFVLPETTPSGDDDGDDDGKEEEEYDDEEEEEDAGCMRARFLDARTSACFMPRSANSVLWCL